MQERSIEEILNNPKFQFIDVRSPGEYEESHIPGAVNIPLFTDEERAEIGTIYKQQGQEDAKWRAMEVVSPKIPQLMSGIREVIKSGKIPAIYCWRGGMRSKAVTTFANLTGMPSVRIIGGFRAYRQYILDQLRPSLMPDKTVVLHGLTGVGKTKILQMLSERGHPTLDLEALACHRGSVFGQIGLFNPNNQKMFDALLYHRLKELVNKPYVILEAESKRIGKVVLPDFIIEAKQQGLHLMLVAPIEVRVKRIYEEYVQPFKHEPWFHIRVLEAFSPIKKRIATDVRIEIENSLENQDYHHFIQLILQHYYDPRYEHKINEYGDTFTTIDVTNLDHAIEQIESVISKELMSTSLIV
jgi:tRNA 2-selenouridine synthase